MKMIDLCFIIESFLKTQVMVALLASPHTDHTNPRAQCHGCIPPTDGNICPEEEVDTHFSSQMPLIPKVSI